MICIVGLNQQAGLETSSETTNLEQIQIVYKFVDKLGRGVAVRNDTVAGEFIEHALSILVFQPDSVQGLR